MNDYHKKAEAVLQQVNQVVLGKEQETAEIFLAFLADGHVLLEDIPGIGKTTMALIFTRSKMCIRDRCSTPRCGRGHQIPDMP